jgi:formate hydrogenlyase subunit 6/NADH:ubiquinone oxidoreductase subunit I
VDLGKCLFCQQCEEVCPREALWLTSVYELAVLNKKDCILDFNRTPPQQAPPKKAE